MQSSPHWKPLEAFLKDDSVLEYAFGREITSTAREDIRQICKFLGLNFRCIGQGSQKRMSALKLDNIREKARAEEMAKEAPAHIASFFRASLKLLPEHRARVTALFVHHYGGERAWSLGDAGDPQALAESLTSAPSAPGAQQKRRRLENGEAEVSAEADSDEGSGAEDITEMLGRWVAVPT